MAEDLKNVDPARDLPLGFILYDTGRLMRKRFEQLARDLSITGPQWRVLFNLDRVPGLNQTQLADQMEIEPITLCRLIDRMEDAGWVRRELDPDDRRARRLYMTDQARPVMAKLRRLGDFVSKQALEGVSPQDLEQCLATLAAIHANLSAVDWEQKASLRATGASGK